MDATTTQTPTGTDVKPLAVTFEDKLRRTTRTLVDRVARAVASLAVTLNRLAEKLGPVEQPVTEARDGVIAPPPPAA